MFTHKPQEYNELGVKVKGEGKYLELAECVMRRRMSAKARGDGREKTVQGVAEQETLPFPQKREGECKKTERFRRKVHKFFAVCTDEREIRNIFFKKTAPFRNKRITFADDKTHPSLFPPQCGVHIAAIFGRYSPEFQRRCSLTYCKKARRSTGEASGLSKTCVIRLRSGAYSEQNRLRWIDRGQSRLRFLSISQRKAVSLRVTSHSAATDGHHQSVESGHRSSEKQLSNARLCGLSGRALQRRRGRHLRLGFRCRDGAPH